MRIYSAQEGKNISSISLSNLDESGVREIDFIRLCDKSHNDVVIHNSNVSKLRPIKELNNGNFELKDVSNNVNPLSQKCVT